MEFVHYFGTESVRLLEQGRLETNLLAQPRPLSCSLKLAPASLRPLSCDQLPEAVEMGVAVVGTINRIAGRPQFTPTASGFFVTDSGALVTCWHVVDCGFPLLGMTVMTRDGRVCPVRQILASNTNSDLAILQVEGSGFTPLPLGADARQGAPVSVLGHPFPWYYMLTTGIVSGYYTLASPSGKLTIFDITADFANGSSGAPVFNDCGAVVGVAKFRTSTGIPGTPEISAKGCLPSSLVLGMIKPQPGP